MRQPQGDRTDVMQVHVDNSIQRRHEPHYLGSAM